MADRQEATVTLASTPASVSRARRYVTGVLAEWARAEGPDGPDRTDTVETVRLVVSELATNAVLHTRGDSPTFTVDVLVDDGLQLYVGVTDSHPRYPRRLPAAVQQDNGRGLVIVRWLAAERGGRLFFTPAEDGGKTVWIRLPWSVPVRTGA
ncbi:ATP-binding protein [Streptomyces gamaensis]|uniref:ATP-binding protein n=1 Tax=Streptomyces gamaensis TaxID=1763542 RepID=A0ABW0Z3W2_9ACTN